MSIQEGRPISSRNHNPGKILEFAERHRDLLVLLAVSLALSPIFAQKIRCWDIWWHLATGRWIVENGAIPETDPFSFTAKGEPWVNVNWLGALFYYGAYGLGGIPGIVATKIAIGFGLALFLGLALRHKAVRLPIIAASMICTTVLVQPRFSMARPMSVGALLCAVGIYLCIRTFERRDKSVLLLPVLLIAWMNVHASAVLAVAMSCLVAAAALFFKTDRTFRLSSLIAFICSAAVFVATGRGRQILTHAFSYTPSSLIVEYTSEWQQLRIDEPMVWIPWSIFAVSILYGAIRFRRHPIALGLAVIGTVLGTRYNRNLFDGILLTAPMMTLACNDLAGWLKSRRLSVAEKSLPAVMVLAILGLDMTFVDPTSMFRHIGFSVERDTYPEDTLERLRELPFGRTMNDLSLGGYLIWREIPGGVYLDGRTAQVFKERHVKELLGPLAEDIKNLDVLADRYDVVYGLGIVGAPVYEIAMISPDWIPVFIGDKTVLFVRKSHAHKLAASNTPLFSLLRHTADLESMKKVYDAILSVPGMEDEFAEQFTLAASMNPDSSILSDILAFMTIYHPESARKVVKRSRSRK